MSKNNLENLLIIGISGVTCGGKTTTAQELNKNLTKSHFFMQDPYYRDISDPKHIWIPELKHINFDIISSLDMEKMHADITNFIRSNHFVPITNEIKCLEEDNTCLANDRLYKKINNSNIQILIIEGFSIFCYKEWLDLFNLKYYFTLDKEECYRRRIHRVYEPPDCPGYFENCVWPEHLKQKEEIKDIDDIQYFENSGQNAMNKILNDISKFI